MSGLGHLGVQDEMQHDPHDDGEAHVLFQQRQYMFDQHSDGGRREALYALVHGVCVAHFAAGINLRSMRVRHERVASVMTFQLQVWTA